jgi:DNA-binding winged helix-turn-helix (wHTH) protein
VKRVHFGDCVFDGESREVLRGNRAVALSPKAFQLLQILIENRPKAVSKTDLCDRLWPRTFVVEANLSNLVGELRRALGDDPRVPRFIRTVHRFGYAFRHESRQSAEDTRNTVYRLHWAGGHALLGEGEHTIGRDADAAIVLDSPSVSRHHARIRVTNNEAVFEDLGSKNGSRIRGRRVDGISPLADGDVITVGVAELTFVVFHSTSSTETVASESKHSARRPSTC